MSTNPSRRRPFPVGSFPTPPPPTPQSHSTSFAALAQNSIHLLTPLYYRLRLYFVAACDGGDWDDGDNIPPLANPPSLPPATTASPVLYDCGEPRQLCGARGIRGRRPGAWGATKGCLCHTTLTSTAACQRHEHHEYTTKSHSPARLTLPVASPPSPRQNVNHVVAGISTGMLYKCTARPQTMVLAGVIGGGLVGASCLAEYGIMSYRR